MKPKSIRVGYGRTTNLGNFESTRLYYEAEVELDKPEDTVPSAIDTTRDYLRDKIKADIKAGKHK